MTIAGRLGLKSSGKHWIFGHHRVNVPSGLHGFLHAWRQLFDRFDEDHSGYISLEEFSNGLTAFGYHLSPGFVSHMYDIYDRRKAGAMTFDLFVQSCISLKRMTDVFKQYDTDRDGYITMSFEEFLRGKFHTRRVRTRANENRNFESAIMLSETRSQTSEHGWVGRVVGSSNVHFLVYTLHVHDTRRGK
jgi:EF hand